MEIKVLILEHDSNLIGRWSDQIKKLYANQREIEVQVIQVETIQEAIALMVQEDIAMLVLNLATMNTNHEQALADFRAVTTAIRRHGLPTELLVVSGTDDDQLSREIHGQGVRSVRRSRAVVDSTDLLDLLKQVVARRTGTGDRSTDTRELNRSVTDLLGRTVRLEGAIERIQDDLNQMRSELNGFNSAMYGNVQHQGLDTKLSLVERDIEHLQSRAASNAKEIQELLQALGYLGLMLKAWAVLWNRISTWVQTHPGSFLGILGGLISGAIALFEFLRK